MADFKYVVLATIFVFVVFVGVNSEIVSTDPISLIQGGEIKAKQYYYDGRENALMPWFQAMEWSQMNDFEPGRIDMATENEIVARALNENFQTSRVFWLGGTDWDQDGEFYWIRTGQNLQYSIFAILQLVIQTVLRVTVAFTFGAMVFGMTNTYCTVAEVRPICQRVT